VWNGTSLVPIVACLLLVGTDGAARGEDTCTTQGILGRQEVTLLIDGQKPFQLEIRDAARIRVTFSARAAPWIQADVPQVSVQAPGTVVHHLRHDGSYQNDMLFVRSDLPLTDLRYGGGPMLTSVALDEGLVARNIEVPCEDLLAGRQAKRTARRDRAERGGDELARSRTGNLVLRDGPGDTSGQLRLEPADAVFFVVGREKDWVKLAWDGPAGAVKGWVPASAVRTVTTRSVTGHGGLGCCAAHPLAADAARRVGRLRPGASIHASPGGTRWALVKSTIGGVEFEDVPKSEWLRILNNPTLHESGCNPTHSWVLRSAVDVRQ